MIESLTLFMRDDHIRVTSDVLKEDKRRMCIHGGHHTGQKRLKKVNTTAWLTVVNNEGAF